MGRYDDVNKAWGDRAFKGYAGATDNPRRYILGGFLALVAVIAVIVLGGWWIGWWFTGQNVNRESHVLRNSYANQQTLRDQITANIGNVLSVTTQIAEVPASAPELKAQRVAIVNIVCGDAAQLTGDPLASDQAQFIKANCYAGNISPASAYNH